MFQQTGGLFKAGEVLMRTHNPKEQYTLTIEPFKEERTMYMETLGARQAMKDDNKDKRN